MRTTDIEAAICIVASDQVWRNPGERWACPADEAEGLLASGAALRVEPEPPEGETDSVSGSRTDHDPDPAGTLTRVSGIGPSTAAALRSAGVETLAELAALSDEDLAALRLDENVQRRIRDNWRGQAARLLEAGASA